MQVASRENEILIDNDEDDRKPAALPSSSSECTKPNETTKCCSAVVEPNEDSPPTPLISKTATIIKKNPVHAVDQEDGDSSGRDLGARFKEPSNSLQLNNQSPDNDAGKRENKKPRTLCMNQRDTGIRSTAANQDIALNSDSNNSHEDSHLEDADREFAARLQQQCYGEDEHSTTSPCGTPASSSGLNDDFQLAMSLQQQEYEFSTTADLKTDSDEINNSGCGKVTNTVNANQETLSSLMNEPTTEWSSSSSAPPAAASSASGADREFAVRLKHQFHNEDEHSTKSPGESPTSSVGQNRDFQLAMSLQQQEYEVSSIADSKNEMKNSAYGKAINAVKKILELVETTKQKYHHYAIHINAVCSDDMVFLAKALLEKQSNFVKGDTPAYVDVGYHYTNSTNLESIRTNGLMTKSERDSLGVVSDRFNGSSYGDGVYTANDPMAFAGYGDTGLIVGRLLGSVKNYSERTGVETTVLVPHRGMMVLKTSAQCLPMIKYDKTVVRSNEGSALITELQKSLQDILDEVFNPGLTAPKYEYAQATGARRINSTIRNTHVMPPALTYAAPQRLSLSINNLNAFCHPPPSFNFQNDCPICQDPLTSPQYCFALNMCNHVFHRGCIQQACKFALKCPTCRISIGAPFGKSPSGSMAVNVKTHMTCGGYPNCGTIEIVYSIYSGVQKHYHENPGQSHSDKQATAYLPNNTEGQNLLKRLKFAFMHGLIFTVGTSVTTGAANQCTWSSIHHKTSPNGGVHGFPDVHYFSNCNEELDTVNVPAAHELDTNGKKSF